MTTSTTSTTTTTTVLTDCASVALAVQVLTDQFAARVPYLGAITTADGGQIQVTTRDEHGDLADEHAALVTSILGEAGVFAVVLTDDKD